MNRYYRLHSVFVIMFCSLLMMACHEGNKKTAIDIEGSIDKQIDFQADDLMKSIKPITLETNSRSILGRVVSILHIDDKNILVYSDNNVKRFDSNGKYICDIGVQGNGHGEHGTIFSFAYNETTDQVFMCGFDNIVYRYDIRGKFVGRSHLQVEPAETVRSIICTDDNGCWGIGSKYTDCGIRLRLCHFTVDGMMDKSTLVYSDDDKVNIGRESFPLFWACNGMKNIKLEYDENIYSYDKSLNSDHYELLLGNIAPTRRTVEDVEFKSQLLKEKCQVLSVLETDKYFFLTMLFKMKYHLAIAQKDSGKVIFNTIVDNPKLNGGLRLDATNDIKIWPTYYNGKCVACVLNVDNLTERCRIMMKDKYGISINKGDNPVIIML